MAIKELTAYQKRISRLIEQFSSTSEMLQGSVIEKYVKCGKENCHCAEGQGHGPAYYLSFKEEGVTKLIYIPHNKVAKVKRQVNKFKKYKEIGAKIVKLNRDILKFKRKE